MDMHVATNPSKTEHTDAIYGPNFYYTTAQSALRFTACLSILIDLDYLYF